MTTLTWRKYREPEVVGQGIAKGTSRKKQLRGASVPAHLATHHPPVGDVAVFGVGKSWWLEPGADIVHDKRQPVIEELPQFSGLAMGFQMGNQGAQVSTRLMTQMLKGIVYVSAQNKGKVAER